MPHTGGRTEDYIIWRSCERFGLLPPGIKNDWDENPPFLQAMLIGYNQIREIEDQEAMSAFFKLFVGSRV